MNCPFCNSKATKMLEQTKITFRKEDFKIQKQFYKCDKCKNQFTTNDLDEVNINQVYNQYRIKYQIPFPEQLKHVRKNYGLTATKMAQILGFGVNVYRNYEKGEIPNQSNGTLLKMILDAKEFYKIVQNKENILRAKDFNKLRAHLEKIIQEKTLNSSSVKYLEKNALIPDEYSGYKNPSLEKVGNVVLYFLEKCDNLFTVKLNKLLFYADFLNFKLTGYSITGLCYQAVQMGPVPHRYDLMYNLLLEENFIEYDLADINDNLVEQPKPLKNFNNSVISEKELHTLEKVIRQFKDMSTGEIVDLSHKEKGWIDQNRIKGLISYQKYGFEISIN